MNKYKLNELGSLNRGKSKHRPRNDPGLYGGDFPFIQTGDVKHSPFYVTNHSQTYNEKGLQQSKLWPAGTLCITIAANIADTAILTYPACFPDSIIGFIPDCKKAATKYVKYLLDTFKLQMQAISQGTTQDNMSLEKLLSIEFPAPELETQRKIAAILSAYDDLIENNKRRIALLENMAEEIYREWFVRFRFPGYQTTEFEKGIPKEWDRENLGALCNVVKRGISPKYSDESEFMVLNQKCIRNGQISLKEARTHDSKVSEEKFIQYCDALINSTGVGTLGRVSIVEFEPNQITVDSHVTICRANPSKIDSCYLASTVAQLQQYFEYMASGSTGQVELNKSLIESIKILIPDNDIQTEYRRVIEPIFEQKQNLFSQIDQLAKTKNLLLPRLISGKLSVEDLDIQFPPSMQDSDT